MGKNLATQAVQEAIQRAFLPPILFVPHIAEVFGIGASAARKVIQRGDCGPFFRVGRRLAIRRESFVAALQAREFDPVRVRLGIVRGRAPSRPVASERDAAANEDVR